MAPRIPISMAVVLALAACSTSPDDACQVDEECPAGFYCRAGDCVYDCTRDSECPAGFRCSARGQCRQGCVTSNGGIEACDGTDNDCDGGTDEDFAGLGDACGAGGCAGVMVCAPDGTAAACDGPAPAGDDSQCNAIDDDCDGETDEDALPRLCPLQEGVCAGAGQVCQAVGDWTPCDYGPDFTEGIDDACDTVDNDCDGETDEDAPMEPVPESGPLATDGLDNNCNGTADEPGGVMVPLSNHAGVWIDAYENQVFDDPDCQGSPYGIDGDDYPPGWPATGYQTVDMYACSLPGVLPSGYLSWYRAGWACEAQGKRLCDKAEWGLGCTGGMPHFFPYGAFFEPGTCNDGWGGAGELVAGGTFQDCTAGNGTYDMPGNMGEWVQNWDPDYPGNAFIGGYIWPCHLCFQCEHCHDCDMLSDPDLSNIAEGCDCITGSDGQDSWCRDQVESFLGVRCCYDAP